MRVLAQHEQLARHLPVAGRAALMYPWAPARRALSVLFSPRPTTTAPKPLQPSKQFGIPWLDTSLGKPLWRQGDTRYSSSRIRRKDALRLKRCGFTRTFEYFRLVSLFFKSFLVLTGGLKPLRVGLAGSRTQCSGQVLRDGFTRNQVGGTPPADSGVDCDK